MNKSLIISVVSMVISVAVAIVFISQNSQKKVAYINFNKVYNEFTYKKELEKEFENIVNERTHILDSLKQQIAIKSSSDTSGLSVLRSRYRYNSQMFEHNNQLLQDQYYEKIVTQLNQYVKDYGDEHSYDVILGANGNGSIMYGHDDINVSDEVLLYINKKYEGK